MWHEVKTSQQAIDLLDGPAEVARLFKHMRPNTVSMWGKRKRFPPKAWLVLCEPMLKARARFSPRLFGMLEPKRGGHDGHR